MKDLAYLLAGEAQETVRRALKVYFAALHERLAGGEADAIEAEWRGLYPWVWAQNPPA